MSQSSKFSILTWRHAIHLLGWTNWGLSIIFINCPIFCKKCPLFLKIYLWGSTPGGSKTFEGGLKSQKNEEIFFRGGGVDPQIPKTAPHPSIRPWSTQLFWRIFFQFARVKSRNSIQKKSIPLLWKISGYTPDLGTFSQFTLVKLVGSS